MRANQDELKSQIKAWLKQTKMSRKEFAEKCFVSPNIVRNWLAKVHIPAGKQAIITQMMESTQKEQEAIHTAKAHWKPYAVMVSTDDYHLIEEAARLDHMTVEEWSEHTLIQDAEHRMQRMAKTIYSSSRAAETPVEYGQSPRQEAYSDQSNPSESATEEG